jgi:uncharacterized protein VcgC/VcgE DUF2780
MKPIAIAFLVALLMMRAVPPAQAQGASPELISALSTELGSTPKQAEGAAGALFGFAKTKLSPADWTKVSGAVPGMPSLLDAAPAVSAASGAAGLGALAGAAGGMAGVASSFSKLGLKPELVAKAIPILTNFVTKSGGAGVGQLLANVLK